MLLPLDFGQNNAQRLVIILRLTFIAFLFSVLFAIFDEWHQSFIPNRDASVDDVIADTCGAALALGFLLALSWWGSGRSNPLQPGQTPPLVPVPVPQLRESQTKRMIDIVLAGLGLLGSAPLWPVIALMIKLDDGGPIFHTEARWGWGGRAFHILKFRTFALDPNQPGAVPSPTGERYFSRVGRFLRARGLDELPQLVNILKGDMSFVGPRPLAVEEIPVHRNPFLLHDPRFVGFKERLAVRPGLTGIAQIYGSKYLSHRHKFRYDLLYIKKRGLWLDLRLLILSFWISLRGRWEIRARKL